MPTTSPTVLVAHRDVSSASLPGAPVMSMLFFVLAFSLSHLSFAQNSQSDFNESVSIHAGMAKHGTGDLSGFLVNVEYQKRFKKKVFWYLAFGSTLHDGYFPLYYKELNGDPIDGSIRHTTGGVQLTGGVGLNFVKTRRHELGIQAGTLVRYQSSSYFDDLAIYHPIVTTFPYPAIVFRNRTPQRTLAVGGMGRLFYNFSLTNHFFIGLNAGLQGDTNGDVITQFLLTAGRKF
ncbi:MAG: hypothetical protein LH606_18285 [Cytophagaceae bacterium]|nr:hypothetical protein [Cytophagaceae bacterium]